MAMIFRIQILPLSLSLIFGTLTLTSAVWAGQGDSFSCEQQMSKDGLTYAKINLKLKGADASSRARQGLVLSEDDLSRFWRQTWPYLKQMADEDDSLIASYFEENFAMINLITTEIHSPSPTRTQRNLSFQNLVIKAIQNLEGLSSDAKLKARHWRDVGIAYRGLITLSRLAYYLEYERRPFPSFDPTLPITPNQIDLIFESLENSNLDHAASAVDRVRRERFYAQLLKSQRSSSSPTAAEVEDRAPVESPPQVIALPNPQWQPETVEKKLAKALAYKQKLSPNFDYEVSTPFRQNLKARLSESLVESSLGPDATTVRRLLRSLVTGSGEYSGLKPLFDIGPGIVEIKARMKGAHKRIFGCLEGSELRLIELKEIPATRQAYSKFIPSDYCAD